MTSDREFEELFDSLQYMLREAHRTNGHVLRRRATRCAIISWPLRSRPIKPLRSPSRTRSTDARPDQFRFGAQRFVKGTTLLAAGCAGPNEGSVLRVISSAKSRIAAA